MLLTCYKTRIVSFPSKNKLWLSNKYLPGKKPSIYLKHLQSARQHSESVQLLRLRKKGMQITASKPSQKAKGKAGSPDHICLLLAEWEARKEKEGQTPRAGSDISRSEPLVPPQKTEAPAGHCRGVVSWQRVLKQHVRRKCDLLFLWETTKDLPTLLLLLKQSQLHKSKCHLPTQDHPQQTKKITKIPGHADTVDRLCTELWAGVLISPQPFPYSFVGNKHPQLCSEKGLYSWTRTYIMLNSYVYSA